MEYEFVYTEVPCGLTNRRRETGYRLSNGVVLLNSERDEKGNYRGGIGMDGAYLMTNTTYCPVYNGQNQLVRFKKMTEQ